MNLIEQINEQIKGDQGATYRRHLGELMPLMHDAYNPKSDPFRSHMGASGIGNECARAVWYNFRWVTPSNHEGQLLRLFNTGHLAEAKFLAMLKCVGVQVYVHDSNGKQFRIQNDSGHFGGSCDGVGVGILVDPALLEFKTSGDKAFKMMLANGVKAAKFEHYVQMQIYMHYLKLTVAVYMVLNKNDESLYTEVVHYDQGTAERYIARAEA